MNTHSKYIMDLNVKLQNFRGKNPPDSSARQTVLRLNTNSMTHKRKNG